MKHRVVIEETFDFEFEVEADSEEEAERIAEDKFYENHTMDDYSGGPGFRGISVNENQFKEI